MRICVYLLARNAERRSHGLTSRPLAHAISRRMAASRPREDAVAPLVGGELALRLRDACHDLGAAHGELLPCALRVGRRHDDVSALRRRRRAAFFLFSTRRCLLCIWAYLCVSDAISLRISHQGSRSGVGRAVRGRKTQINADAALIRLFTSNKDSGTRHRHSAVRATVRSGSVS